MSLRVAVTPDCKPPVPPALTLAAEGHFPASDDLFVPVDALGDVQRLPGFPGETLQYHLEANGMGFRGAGLVRAAMGTSQDVLLLPFGRVCRALEHREPSAFDGGQALAAFGDAELLMAGGRASDARSSGLAKRAELSHARWRELKEPLFVPRIGASASTSGPDVIVAGGSQLDAEGAPALASFERFSEESRSFVELGRLTQARVDHAATTAADGSIWLAGGRSEVAGEPLDTLEHLPPGESAFILLDARLSRPSARLKLLAFAAGRVVAVDFQGSGPPTLQRFDALGERVHREAPLSYESTPALVVVSLGERLVGFEVDAEQRTTGRVCTRSLTGDDRCVEDWLTPLDGLEAARAVALRDGRIVITGRRNGQAVARVVDLGRRVVDSRRLEDVPLWSGRLGDGSVAFVHARGIDLLREDTQSDVSGLPSTLLAPDAPALALDLVDRWRWQGLTLIAEADGARADLASLRFESVSMQVRVDGALEILLGVEGAPARAVRVGDELGTDRCQLAGADSHGELTLVRKGEELELRAGNERRHCTLQGLAGPVRIGLRAVARGTRIERFLVRRL